MAARTPDQEQAIKRLKAAARQKLGYHVRTGKIKKFSCEWGGCNSLETEGHHLDYNHPLVVLWLCRDHHMDLHTSLAMESRV